MNAKTLYEKTLVRPFVYMSSSIREISVLTLVLLLLQVALLVVTESYAALVIIVSCVAASLVAHFVGWRCRIPPVLCIAQGIIVGMLLPEHFPPATAFFIVLFITLLSKYSTGAFAGNWVNPAALSVAVAWIVGMSAFPQISAFLEILQVKNPSQFLIQNGTFPTFRFDAPITAALNNSIFRFMNMSIPDGYISLLWDTGSVIPAFRFNVLTLVSSIALFASGMYGLLIPSCFLVSYCTLVRFAGPLFFGGVVGQGDILLALLTGGTIFFATFVIQCYGTTPVTYWGKTLYGILCGMLAFFIAGCGTSSVGMAFAILSANLFSPLIQMWEDARNKKSLRAMLAFRAKDATASKKMEASR